MIVSAKKKKSNFPTGLLWLCTTLVAFVLGVYVKTAFDNGTPTLLLATEQQQQQQQHQEQEPQEENSMRRRAVEFASGDPAALQPKSKLPLSKGVHALPPLIPLQELHNKHKSSRLEAHRNPPKVKTKKVIRTGNNNDQANREVENAANVQLPQTGAKVVCGGHTANSCAECPQGHGESWCHGECTWCQGECMTQAQKLLECNNNNMRWNPPTKEDWFVPPVPLTKFNRTISVVLPCASEHEFFQRTIQSVVAATPPEILQEIVVIDDNSNPPLEPMYDATQLERAAKIVFVRTETSIGLIDAKHRGAEASSGDIIFFLDCHCKPALGYWEPFVREIAAHPKRVVVPTITHLDPVSWKESGRQKKGGGLSKCYLTFDSEFKWTHDETPWVPIMSGGLLAIGREWFFQLGGHDQSMKGWGGENIDLSLRIWRCGGDIVSAPQSFVAHMWRGTGGELTKAKYARPAGSARQNRARAMLGHAPDFFRNKTVTFPEFWQHARDGGASLDVTSIQNHESNLQCKSFEWYLGFFKHIYRDGGVIPKEAFQLTYDGGKTCLSLKTVNWGWNRNPYNDKVLLSDCKQEIPERFGTEYWALSNRKRKGGCCYSLRVWNTDQCLVRGLGTAGCDLDAGQPAKLTQGGKLQTGNKCISVKNDQLVETDCKGATATWTKYRPFTPVEFALLSKEMQAIWNEKDE